MRQSRYTQAWKCGSIEWDWTQVASNSLLVVQWIMLSHRLYVLIHGVFYPPHQNMLLFGLGFGRFLCELPLFGRIHPALIQILPELLYLFLHFCHLSARLAHGLQLFLDPFGVQFAHFVRIGSNNILMFLSEEVLDGGPALNDILMYFVPDLLLLLDLRLSVLLDQSLVLLPEHQCLSLDAMDVFGLLEGHLAHLPEVVFSFALVLHLQLETLLVFGFLAYYNLKQKVGTLPVSAKWFYLMDSRRFHLLWLFQICLTMLSWLSCSTLDRFLRAVLLCSCLSSCLQAESRQGEREGWDSQFDEDQVLPFDIDYQINNLLTYYNLTRIVINKLYQSNCFCGLSLLLIKNKHNFVSSRN